jgi:deoxyribonuclease V
VSLSIQSSKYIILQKKLASKVISKNVLPKKICSICAVDASYKNGKVRCSAVIFNKNKMKVAQSATIILADTTPYISGLFMLKEAKPILNALKKLTKRFDILLVDGNGKLHPRNFGLACYIGLIINKPTIGIAKKLLCGTVQSDSTVKLGGKIIGSEIKFEKKKIYVSVGHKINLQTCVKIVKELTLKNNWYPEPLRIADLNSKFIK